MVQFRKRWLERTEHVFGVDRDGLWLDTAWRLLRLLTEDDNRLIGAVNYLQRNAQCNSIIWRACKPAARSIRCNAYRPYDCVTQRILTYLIFLTRNKHTNNARGIKAEEYTILNKINRKPGPSWTSSLTFDPKTDVLATQLTTNSWLRASFRSPVRSTNRPTNDKDRVSEWAELAPPPTPDTDEIMYRRSLQACSLCQLATAVLGSAAFLLLAEVITTWC